MLYEIGMYLCCIKLTMYYLKVLSLLNRISTCKLTQNDLNAFILHRVLTRVYK